MPTPRSRFCRIPYRLRRILDDNDLYACACGIWSALVERKYCEGYDGEDCTFVDLNRAALLEITGKGKRDAAQNLLKRLEDYVAEIAGTSDDLGEVLPAGGLRERVPDTTLQLVRGPLGDDRDRDPDHVDYR